MKTRFSIFAIILMAVSMIARAEDKAAPGFAGEKVKSLAEFLPGTRWFWEGSEDHLLEFRKDGTVDLDYWTLPTDWKVTGPSQVTFTMHFKTENKTASVTFTDDRSSFSGIQFRGGVISKSPRAPDLAADERFKPLAELLAGTRWFWQGSKDHILEFRKDGTVDLDYWTLPTDWKVTGPSQVTFTMHFKTEDKTAFVTFTDDRSSFSGIQFRGGVISKSPRAPDLAADKRFKPLAELLAGTRWFWQGSKDHVLEFRKDGTVDLDYWTLPTDWKVTGPSQVTFTMHFKTEDKTAFVAFSDDRSSFSGIQFRGGVISKSPRVSESVVLNSKMPVTVVPFGVDISPGPIVRVVELNWQGISSTKKEKLLAQLRTQVGQPYLSAAIMQDEESIRAAGGRLSAMLRDYVPGGGCKVAFDVEDAGAK